MYIKLINNILKLRYKTKQSVTIFQMIFKGSLRENKKIKPKPFLFRYNHSFTKLTPPFSFFRKYIPSGKAEISTSSLSKTEISRITSPMELGLSDSEGFLIQSLRYFERDWGSSGKPAEPAG